MRKWIILLTLACLVAFSGVAMAEEVNLLDGVKLIPGTDLVIDKNGYATGSPRFFNPGEAFGNQEVKVTLPMSALLPCYLEMEFQGNDLNVMQQTWGPGAKSNYSPGNIYIAFHPEVGGYIHGDWSLYPDSHDSNYEVPLGSDAFIRACDTFRTALWSNMNYKYTVTVPNGGLKGGLDPNAVLPVQMRAAIKLNTDPGFGALTASDWTYAHDFSVNGVDAVLITGGNFSKSTYIYQQFRVPFNKDFSAGHYTGSISFTAATI